jgi:lysophospholipase L1-like esterase
MAISHKLSLAPSEGFHVKRIPRANKTSPAQERPYVVACLGSSSTAGKGQAFNWIDALQKRLEQERFVLRNCGVGGDLSYNALQRLPHVIGSNPAKVVVLIGANDVLALVSAKVRRFFRVAKRLPCDPSAEWFRVNLHAIAQAIKKSTDADLAFCSLHPIGEDLDSMIPFQCELNMQIRRFNTIIQEVAADESVDYIGVYEAFAAQMKDSQRRAFSEFRFLPFYHDAFRTLVLRRSSDEVSKMNGWVFHTDGIHLNSRGGLITADLVCKFIEK